ncbi:MAG: peptidoglycan DD-metalloendopeptidase family protein [Woeseiaceae bacterium]|jgi:septal ring factor EnvC (AmiA/AmiB activator)|nr:peptidoglycan DD-metalloendopeptidase family protein [Woeseiaceae bacterium]
MTPASRPFRLIPALAAALVLAAFPVAAQDDDLARIKEQELEAVRDRISDLKASMDKATRARDKVTSELQAAEVKIGEQQLLIRDLERDRDRTARRLGELEGEIETRETELRTESGELAEQVRAAYMAGGQERLKLLLNQQDPATLGRLLAYYDYLNRHRAGNIRSVNDRLKTLAELRSEAVAEKARLDDIAERRYAELAVLNSAQEERRALIAELETRMASESREIERLAAEEKQLGRLIAELTSILSDYPITSEEAFASYKGRLTWPIKGQLVRDYGQPRSGALTWNGVVLAAPRGSDVRAVYHGRVVFADWLAGMGLLIIIDHGDDYLTLYGYNETLLKNPGDWVAPGDVIATVGDSGGQLAPGLYFEVRKGTRTVNPRSWVTRQPGDR